MRCRLTLLELVERDAGLDVCADDTSRCAASFAWCAASNFDRYLEFRRYDGTKKELDIGWLGIVLPTMLANFLE